MRARSNATFHQRANLIIISITIIGIIIIIIISGIIGIIVNMDPIFTLHFIMIIVILIIIIILLLIICFSRDG